MCHGATELTTKQRRLSELRDILGILRSVTRSRADMCVQWGVVLHLGFRQDVVGSLLLCKSTCRPQKVSSGSVVAREHGVAFNLVAKVGWNVSQARIKIIEGDLFVPRSRACFLLLDGGKMLACDVFTHEMLVSVALCCSDKHAWSAHVVRVMFATLTAADTNVITMFEADCTLREWKFGASLAQLVTVLIQIMCTLQVLQDECAFRHKDLHDANILMDLTPRGAAWEAFPTLVYSPTDTIELRVRNPGVRPLIADFGTSSILMNDVRVLRCDMLHHQTKVNSTEQFLDHMRLPSQNRGSDAITLLDSVSMGLVGDKLKAVQTMRAVFIEDHKSGVAPARALVKFQAVFKLPGVEADKPAFHMQAHKRVTTPPKKRCVDETTVY